MSEGQRPLPQNSDSCTVKVSKRQAGSVTQGEAMSPKGEHKLAHLTLGPNDIRNSLSRWDQSLALILFSTNKKLMLLLGLMGHYFYDGDVGMSASLPGGEECQLQTNMAPEEPSFCKYLSRFPCSRQRRRL